MNIPKLEDLSTFDRHRPSFKKHYPELYEHIVNTIMVPNNLSWAEALYWYYHDLKERPVCKLCGGPVRFLDIKDGYTTYCGGYCAQRDPDTTSKIRVTTMKRWGVTSPMKSEKIRQKHANTMVERYGKEHALQVDEILERQKNTCMERYGHMPLSAGSIRDKRDATCIKRYGTNTPTKTEEVKQKTAQTNLERWGTDNPARLKEIKDRACRTSEIKYGASNPMQCELIQKKSRQTCVQRYGYPTPLEVPEIQQRIRKSQRVTLDKKLRNKYPDVLDFGELWKVRCPHLGCTKCSNGYYEISPSGYWARRYYKVEPCTNIAPYNAPGLISDTSIELFIQKELDRLDISYETNVRNIISPKELDIYIPSLKIAIECNGIFWHSDKFRARNYHYEKWKRCNEQGIQLLTFWEDQIHNQPDIVRSILKSKLSGAGVVCMRSIGARECIVRSITSSETIPFLQKYHIQGKTTFSLAYGLYFENELIAVMTFGKTRPVQGHEAGYELSRFCTKTGVHVVGGAGRLFKHFVDDVDPDRVISYSSCDISNGDLYKKLGFISSNPTIGYWYIEPGSMKRYHRSSFTRSNLIKRGLVGVNEQFTEQSVMEKLGYFKIYDSGQIRWTWTK